VITYTE